MSRANRLCIKARKLYTWEYKDCNDCDDIGMIEVKYPKLKAIEVCIICYNKYYQDKIKTELSYGGKSG